MRNALALVALVLALGFAAPASAHTKFPLPYLTQHNTVLVTTDEHGVETLTAAPVGYHFILDTATWKIYTLKDPAAGDDTTTFSNGFLRNQNAALVVALDGSSTVSVLAPLPGNANTAAGSNQSIGIQGYDGTTNMVPLTETSNALDINLKSQSGGLTINTKVSSSTSGGYGSTALDFSSAATAQNVKTGAGSLYKIQWACAQAMTSTTTFTVYDNTAASGKVIGIYTFLAGGYDTWTLPGYAFATGIEVIASTTTGQAGCKLMVYFT